MRHKNIPLDSRPEEKKLRALTQPYTVTPDLDKTFAAWRTLVETGSISGHLLREHTVQAWQRSKNLGCNPTQGQVRRYDYETMEAVTHQNKNLIDWSKPFMAALSESLRDFHHSIMLSDRNVVVLNIFDGEKSIGEPNSVPPPGSMLSEQFAGANGLATAAATGSYVELVGPEHYIGGFHEFTCQGAPIYDLQSNLIGVLSASFKDYQTIEHTREILICSSKGIESEAIVYELEQALERVEPHKAHLFEKLWQDIMQLHNSGRLGIELAIEMMSKQGHKNYSDISGEALRVAAEFRRQAKMWKLLADKSVVCAAPQSGPQHGEVLYLLSQDMEDIVKMLKTEGQLRNIKLSLIYGNSEPIFAKRYDEVLRRFFSMTIMSLDRAEDLHVPEVTIRLYGAKAEGPGVPEVQWNLGEREVLRFEIHT